MQEPKPFASLTSGLLARKGDARPAMRPQAFAHPNPASLDTSASFDNSENLDDLGWNDMGHEDHAQEYPEHVPSSIAALTPAPRPSTAPPMETSPVVQQQRALEASFAPEPPEGVIEEREDLVPHEPVKPARPAEPAEVVALPPRRLEPALGKGKCAFTLRLDEQRHLRLRLATAVQNRSAQRIVTEALDAYLNALPELDTLAQQVPARSGHRN